MAIYADRVKENTTTTGTGTVNLAGAVTGYRTFVSGVGNGGICYYCIAHQTANEWEVGIGTVTSGSPDTLSRTTVLSSSNSGSLMSFSAGTKDVFVTIPTAASPIVDSSLSVSDRLQRDGNWTRHPPTYVLDSFEIPEPSTVEIGTDRWLEIDEVDGPLASISYTVRVGPNSNQSLAEFACLYVLDYYDITESYALEIPATALMEIAETAGWQDFDIS